MNETATDWRKLFEEWRLYDIAFILGDTSYCFRCALHGMEGLARCDGTHFELIAVISHEPGRGHFRAFVETLKKTFPKITVWAIMEPNLAAALTRYGFSPELKKSDDGELVDGYVWLRSRD